MSDNDTIELKPCPMSGKKAYLIKEGYNFESQDLFHVICHKSGIRTKKYLKPKDAILAWNTRADRQAAQVDVEGLKRDADAVCVYLDKNAAPAGERYAANRVWRAIEHLTTPKQDGWRDIESAPKDGTLVLLPHKQYGVVTAKHWDSPKDALQEWLMPEREIIMYAPTHWMPLPTPPKTGE